MNDGGSRGVVEVERQQEKHEGRESDERGRLVTINHLLLGSDWMDQEEMEGGDRSSVFFSSVYICIYMKR